MARHNAKHEKRKQTSAKKAPVKKIKSVSPEDTAKYARKIKTFLQMTARKQMKQSELAVKCRAKRNLNAYDSAIALLLKNGEIIASRQSYKLSNQEECFKAETVRLAGAFGFIQDEEGKEYFVPGKFLLGSLTGDKVLARGIASRTGSPEAEIVSILEEAPQAKLSGVIVATEYGLCFLSEIAGMPLHIDYHQSCQYKTGDKVLAEVIYRGSRHMEHIVKITVNFGSADSAENCMQARIAELEIPVAFTEHVQREAVKVSAVGVTEFDTEGRKDFRQETVFTIDGAHTKDMDDAVSIQKKPDGSYILGVHIADVSYYVRPNSPLDGEAFRRGTSIYYADKVIPMLPKQLSNGICSLNPNENRLTLSAVMQISPEGDLTSYEFFKSVICSKVKGVYEECNQILAGTASPEILEKYQDVKESLFLLEELTDKLEQKRQLRGAPELESTESALLLDETGKCVGLTALQRGKTERIIEACMLCANESAAKLAREKQFPLVYRIHENPSPERIASLKELLCKLTQKEWVISPEEVKPADIQKILNDARGEIYFPAVNAFTLRTMAKARYSEKPAGHFGLALADYAHFTSPIRRYPDLTVHRIISDYLDGADKDWLNKRYQKFTENAAQRSSDTELRAVQLEREADACYAAEYMQSHVGEIFHGVITSVTDFGMYVTLDNMAEGLLHIHDLPEGQYEVEEGWYIKNTLTGTEFKLGDEIQVLCTKAEVSTGHIDLAIA
ncbi:MAG: ribonuclease R [Oscillospiraceae bacterium]|nr:ribonuclease R [Oscillospiraceae bacterium]